MFVSQVIFVAMMIHTEIGISAEPWRSVNDGVMGGISSGGMVRVDDMLRFEGELSLENNGGFASVRRLVDMELSMAKSVRLRLRGDGREYQFRLRTNDRLDGIAWRAKFLTTGDWQTINLEFAEFEPVFRGRLVSDAGPLNPGEIHQIGLMLADKQAGPFRLDIKSIQFHQAEPDQAVSKRNRSKE
jgi:monofunctional biosynthetic peptidoglycan transglycosylase